MTYNFLLQIDQVVLEYNDIFKQAKDDRLQSAHELPYFEGDFWPNVLEESIKELEQEEEDRKQAEANEQAAAEEVTSWPCSLCSVRQFKISPFYDCTILNRFCVCAMRMVLCFRRGFRSHHDAYHFLRFQVVDECLKF